jgi:methyl-accepting chemotaxis protein
MKISARIFMINIAFLVMVILIGTLSLYQLYTQNETFEQSKAITAALRNQGEADMMHDGLRADVLFAIKLAREGDTAGKEGAIASTQEHSENFRRLIREVDEADLSVEVEETLEKLKEPLERYISSATSLTAKAFDDTDHLNLEYEKFEEDFEFLEGAMEEFSGVIQSQFDSINANIVAKERLIAILLVLALAASIVLIVMSGLISRKSIVVPIREITQTMESMARKDLSVVIPYRNDKSEIGDMSKTLQVFKQALESEVQVDAEKLVEQKAREEKLRLVNTLIQNFDRQVGSIVDALSAAASQMETSAKSMAQNSDDSARSANTVAYSAQQSSSSVGAVASATEELSASIHEITTQVTNSSSVAVTAQERAVLIQGQMNTLVDATGKIGQVITMITAIAEQTNLLALNATIESARAGEAGKGFAVVAGEVKNLAGQTAKATEEISLQIQDVQKATMDSNKSVEEIVQAINMIKETSTTISVAVEEQGAATSEIARSIQQASTQTSEVTQGITEVTTLSMETLGAAQIVLGSAQDLAKQSISLRHTVDEFLAQMKKAA